MAVGVNVILGNYPHIGRLPRLDDAMLKDVLLPQDYKDILVELEKTEPMWLRKQT